MSMNESSQCRLMIEKLRQGGFTIIVDGDRIGIRPKGELPDHVIEWIRDHKSSMLDVLRSEPRPDPLTIWSTVVDSVSLNTIFDNDLIEGMRSSSVTWQAESTTDQGKMTATVPDPVSSCPRCGSTVTKDVPLDHHPHDGKSIRRDCGECGRFVSWPRWNGKDPDPLP